MNACSNSDVLRVVYFFSIIIDIVKIVIPIALIIYGLLDFSKAIINSDEKLQKKSISLFFKRIIYAVLVFAVPWIVEVLMVTLGDLLGKEGTVNFTDCLDNANSVCLDAMDSKDIGAIRKACDVPSDYKIEDDTNISNSGSSTNVVTSDKNITFSYKYVSNGTTMPYALYTPSTASKGKQTPLIIWLHGQGEIYVDESKFKDTGLLKELNKWKLDGFNAYVLCPHLSGTGFTSWKGEEVKNKIDELLDKIIKDYNIDQEKIVISGHSLGAIGTEYLTYKKPKYFSAMVVLSGYYNEHRQEIKDTGIPVLGFVGSSQSDIEDPNSYNYMMGDFAMTYGKENVTSYFTAFHGQVPAYAFNEDKNNDNKSDLIEWMLRQ